MELDKACRNKALQEAARKCVLNREPQATAAIYLPPRERRACVSEIAILGRSPTTTEADCFVVPPCMMVLGGNAEQSRSLRSVFFLLLFLLCMGVGMWITPLGFESFRAFSRGGVR
jgi:hypothetical protein